MTSIWFYDPEHWCYCGSRYSLQGRQCPIRPVKKVSWNIWNDEYEYEFVGPNAKNNAKLNALQLRKNRSYGFAKIALLYYTNTDCGMPVGILIQKSSKEELDQLKREREEWERTQSSQYASERGEFQRYKTIGKRHTRKKNLGRWSKPQLDDLEALEEAASRPRNRKQRGFGRAYLPTKSRRYSRREKKCWKRKRKVHWHESKPSFRFLSDSK